MDQLATGDTYLQADSTIHRALIQHYDLYTREIRHGYECYVLFHPKGAAPAQPFPEKLYIRERDIIQSGPVSAASEGKPTGRAAARMITRDYDTEILNNNNLDTRAKIDLTVHCSCQVMKDLFSNTVLSSNDFETIRQIGYSFLCFTELILRESQALEILIGKLMEGSRNESTHAVNVSLYSGMLASELTQLDLLRMDNERLQNLYIGTLLHDLGKTMIKPEILQKPGKISRQDYEAVKKHPVYSAELAAGADLPEESREVILYHHEKWNGGGYPFNLCYQAIPPLARVAAICDVFDALTTRRSYRPARKPFEALTLMKRNLSGSFYVLFLDTFIHVLGRGSSY